MQDEVIYRYLTGKCTPDEERQIMEWYQRDPENHQRAIDRVRFIFEGVLVHQVIGAMENRPKLGCVRTPMMKYRLNSPLLRHRPDNV